MTPLRSAPTDRSRSPTLTNVTVPIARTADVAPLLEHCRASDDPIDVNTTHTGLAGTEDRRAGELR